MAPMNHWFEGQYTAVEVMVRVQCSVSTRVRAHGNGSEYSRVTFTLDFVRRETETAGMGRGMLEGRTRLMESDPLFLYISTLRSERATSLLITREIVSHHAVVVPILVLSGLLWRSWVQREVLTWPAGYWLVVFVFGAGAATSLADMGAKYLTARHYQHLNYLGLLPRHVRGLLTLALSPEIVGWVAALMILTVSARPWWEITLGTGTLAAVAGWLTPQFVVLRLVRPPRIVAGNTRLDHVGDRLMSSHQVGAVFAKDFIQTGWLSFSASLAITLGLGLLPLAVSANFPRVVGYYFSLAISAFGVAHLLYRPEVGQVGEYFRRWLNLSHQEVIRYKIPPLLTILAVQLALDLALESALGRLSIGAAAAAAAAYAVGGLLGLCCFWCFAWRASSSGQLDDAFIIMSLVAMLVPGLGLILGIRARQQLTERRVRCVEG